MPRRRTIDLRVTLIAATFGAVAVVYAWIATGVTPFTTTAYVLVALPSVALLVVYARLGVFTVRQPKLDRLYQERAGRQTLAQLTPWLAVLAGALTLEVVGLALGGRSTSVPTLSTEMDHLLVTHWGRWALYVAWLAVGAWPARGLLRARRAKSV